MLYYVLSVVDRSNCRKSLPTGDVRLLDQWNSYLGGVMLPILHVASGHLWLRHMLSDWLAPELNRSNCRKSYPRVMYDFWVSGTVIWRGVKLPILHVASGHLWLRHMLSDWLAQN
ncbi:hypothetical protein CEXT_285691 [Caerostris extrusa]|uniref:Uncharacterized protein n=1 Tax=Caerostris extrusa TaxID=172846 RepID=A0AAV4XFL7_CAEEX|nr:hypothetical protein CEXT_285691 [Caerostris extrusa]